MNVHISDSECREYREYGKEAEAEVEAVQQLVVARVRVGQVFVVQSMYDRAQLQLDANFGWRALGENYLEALRRRMAHSLRLTTHAFAPDCFMHQILLRPCAPLSLSLSLSLSLAFSSFSFSFSSFVFSFSSFFFSFSFSSSAAPFPLLCFLSLQLCLLIYLIYLLVLIHGGFCLRALALHYVLN